MTCIWGVLPVKDLADAKSRLAPLLTPEERRTLFPLMVEDVLSALATTRGLAGVLVLTRDTGAAALAQRYGARVEPEPENAGQSAAVTRAARLLAKEGAEGIVQLPGDVPLATAAEIEAVLAHHGAAPAVTLVPAHDRRGSNCVAVSPPGLIAFRFGNDSFLPHLAEAEAAGVEARVLEMPGIALDVDTPEDLARLWRHGGSTRTHDWLRASGIATRLSRMDDGR